MSPPNASRTRVLPVHAARFDALWARHLRAKRAHARRMRAELFELYSSPGRYFHNLGHIADCLGHFDDIMELLDEPDAVEIALWFHDAIYVPGAPDNERNSARMFMDRSGGINQILAIRVLRLIMATKHTGRSHPGDRGFMVDIDLAGFGAPWEDFMRRGSELRSEFAAQSDAEYCRGQVAFLLRLKSRPHFFATPYFRKRYEARAKDNVARLLELRLAQGFGTSSDPGLSLRTAPQDATH